MTERTGPYRSQWRLFTSALTEDGARAAGTSVLAGLLVSTTIDLGIAPYFQGGFKVDFELDHGGDWDEVTAAVTLAFERVCVSTHQVEAGPDVLELWCDALNVPRVEALSVVLDRGD
ncbi:MAG: hypothetical protein AAF533_24990 [Acidobacteriota bacterium]